MFGFTLKKREPISGLSAAMRTVDRYMLPDSSIRQLDFNAGYAHGKIVQMFETGEITENEKEAAQHVLKNQHEKLSAIALVKGGTE